MSGGPGARAPVVDLRSDTVTRPSPGMREAMRDAEVGDDVLGDDPTVRALEERVAGLLGKERALFFPSGIMANQTALAVLGRPGGEVVVEARAHLVSYEYGAAAALSGLQVRTVEAPYGVLTPAQVEAALRPPSRYLPETVLVALENTHMDSGGRVMPPAVARAHRALADRHGLPIHLDGARLWHAAAAAGVEPRAYAELADTVMVALSKGLGAPVGSMLAGPAAVLEAAWRVRRRFG
ncbi:MAG: low specificity L-threonine aldolase, partial [Gemmatimonadetes bacterium]